MIHLLQRILYEIACWACFVGMIREAIISKGKVGVDFYGFFFCMLLLEILIKLHKITKKLE